jgi:hypothetical protein
MLSIELSHENNSIEFVVIDLKKTTNTKHCLTLVTGRQL